MSPKSNIWGTPVENLLRLSVPAIQQAHTRQIQMDLRSKVGKR